MFLAFVQLRLVPAWMVLVIVLREFVITGVRLFAASRHVVLSAATEGKHKTVSQLVTLVVILCVLFIRELAGPAGLPPRVETVLQAAILVLLWLTVILTLVSGASFFYRHRSILRSTVTR